MRGNDRHANQQNLMEQRDTHSIFKHLKSLKKLCNLPQVPTGDGILSRNTVKIVDMFEYYFHSVFTQKEHFNIQGIATMKPLLTILSF